jgi:hypothetical protein
VTSENAVRDYEGRDEIRVGKLRFCGFGPTPPHAAFPWRSATVPQVKWRSRFFTLRMLLMFSFPQTHAHSWPRPTMQFT